MPCTRNATDVFSRAVFKDASHNKLRTSKQSIVFVYFLNGDLVCLTVCLTVHHSKHTRSFLLNQRLIKLIVLPHFAICINLCNSIGLQPILIRDIKSNILASPLLLLNVWCWFTVLKELEIHLRTSSASISAHVFPSFRYSHNTWSWCILRVCYLK